MSKATRSFALIRASLDYLTSNNEGEVFKFEGFNEPVKTGCTKLHQLKFVNITKEKSFVLQVFRKNGNWVILI